MTGKRGLLWLLAGIALALLAGRALAAVYADWAFHRAHGAGDLWRTALLTGATMRLATFIAAFTFTFGNLYAVRHSIVSLVLPRRVGDFDFGESVPPHRLTTIAVGGAFVVALLFAALGHDWTEVALAFGGRPFGEIESYGGNDLGFFVNWLPFERSLQAIVTVLVAIVSVIVVVLYWGTPSVRWDERGLYVSTWVRRHLGILGALVILLVGWDWRLDRFALLVSGTGDAGLGGAAAFGRFDHRVLTPYLVLLSFAALPVAVVFALAVWRGWVRIALALTTLLIVGGPVTRVLMPAVAGAGRDPATDARERPYLVTRALYTQRAFGIDRIHRVDRADEGAAATSPSAPAVTAAQASRWVSAWDPAALTRYLELERRGTDVEAFAWQGGAEGLSASLLRGPPPESPPGARWPADRLLANAVDARGLPVAAPGALAGGIGGVLVWPGASPWALVADTIGRLPAPPFESTFERVAQAWDLQNPRLLAVEPPHPRPRLVTHRDVRDRLERLAPFFRAGPSILPLVRGDSLYWVVELFAVAKEYPLSDGVEFAGVVAHYVRHAATAVVQAQSGRVMMLPVVELDSLSASWVRRFPSLFTPRAEAPAWLEAALPPPVDLVLVQGAVAGRTGFLGDSARAATLARVDDADADLVDGPPTLFQRDTSGRLAWAAPVGNASALLGTMTSTGGLAPRVSYRPHAFTLGWTGALERLQAAADEAGIGRALIHSRRGRVQTIPLEGGPAFVQSFYEWPPDGPPRLAGVVALREGRATVARTVAEALGEPAQPAPRALPADVLRARAAALYDAMEVARRAGDWRAYGEAWAALGRLLGRP